MFSVGSHFHDLKNVFHFSWIFQTQISFKLVKMCKASIIQDFQWKKNGPELTEKAWPRWRQWKMTVHYDERLQRQKIFSLQCNNESFTIRQGTWIKKVKSVNFDFILTLQKSIFYYLCAHKKRSRSPWSRSPGVWWIFPSPAAAFPVSRFCLWSPAASASWWHHLL